MPNTLIFSVTDAVATITFNRPEHMNSFNKEMGDELQSITESIRADNKIRAVLLQGAGHLFMAGGDIQFFYEGLDKMPEGVLNIVRTVNVAILNLMQMPKPVLAAVHGSVAGVGMSFMAACDLVIAADNTKFTTAYSGIGISPDGGLSYLLPRIVGTKKAMEWLMLSEVFDAKCALQNGLVNWVVDPAALQEEAQRLLKKLSKGPTQSYASIKKLVNTSWHNTLETQLECEGRGFEVCSVTQDFKAGVTGFLKKQKPEFIGK